MNYSGTWHFFNRSMPGQRENDSLIRIERLVVPKKEKIEIHVQPHIQPHFQPQMLPYKDKYSYIFILDKSHGWNKTSPYGV